MGKQSTNLKTIVIRKVDYGESDLILGLLTKTEGKISVFARGAKRSKKRFGSALDLFVEMDAQVKAPRNLHGLWTLESIQIQNTHVKLRQNLMSISTTSYVSECLWHLLGDGDPHEDIYLWLQKTFRLMSEFPDDLVAHVKLDLEMLQLCGYRPSWKSCVECHQMITAQKVFFAYDRGGVLCANCKKSNYGSWLRPDAFEKTLQGEHVEKRDLYNLRQSLNGFVNFTLGRMPNSQKFREDVLGGC